MLQGRATRKSERPYISATGVCVRHVGGLMRLLNVANLTIFISILYDDTAHLHVSSHHGILDREEAREADMSSFAYAFGSLTNLT
jgi:hypothetical protein